jgi:DNA-binding GntR family transcriptional regulator
MSKAVRDETTRLLGLYSEVGPNEDSVRQHDSIIDCLAARDGQRAADAVLQNYSATDMHLSSLAIATHF